MTYTKVVTLKLLLVQFHFNHRSMAIVLSLADIDALPWYFCTMNISNFKAIHVHKPSGKVLVFKPCADGLFYYDTAQPEDHSVKSKSTITEY